MDENYGKKVGQAIQAVLQLHSDIGRLFQELDGKEYNDWESVFGSFVTKNVPKDVKKHWWMPYFVYRYYRQPSVPALVEGVTCCFFESSTALEEPQFVVSQVRYKSPGGKPVECSPWDVLKLYYDDKEAFEPGKPIPVSVEDNDKFDSARLLVVPIYSIQRREAVTELIARIRGAAEQASEENT